MKKIIVTGGCGFIGSHLTDRLVEKGYEVIVIDNLSTGKIEYLNSSAKFYKIDIRDKEIEGIFKEEKPDIVFHLAAQIDVRKSLINPFEDIDININGSINIIENFLKYGEIDKKKFIFASTGGAIYGEVKKLPADENFEPFPISPYGISKLTVEKYLYYYWFTKGLNYVCLRFGNVYGPRQDTSKECGVISIFTNKFLKNEKVVIYGDGNQTRDFIYVDDVIEALLISMNEEIIGIFNVGTEGEISVNQIYQYLVEITGKNPGKIYEKEREEVKRIYLSIEKLKKYGWYPKISIKEGIKRTFEYFSNI